MPLLEGDEPFSVFPKRDSSHRERKKRGAERVDSVWKEKEATFFFSPWEISFDEWREVGGNEVEGGNVALTLIHIICHVKS